MTRDGRNPGSESLQLDGAMVYAATIETPFGVMLAPGTLVEVTDMLGSAMGMYGQVSARIEEHASYS